MWSCMNSVMMALLSLRVSQRNWSRGADTSYLRVDGKTLAALLHLVIICLLLLIRFKFNKYIISCNSSRHVLCTQIGASVAR